MFGRIASYALMALLLIVGGMESALADLPAPIALPVAVTTTKNMPVQITLVGQHTSTDGFSYQIKTTPAHGQLGTVVDNHVLYTPDNGYVGSDSFTYSVTDSVGESFPATVSITVTPRTVSNVVALPTLSIFALCILGALVAMVAVRRARVSR